MKIFIDVKIFDGMKRIILLFCSLSVLAVSAVTAKEKQAYAVYTSDGKASDYHAMLSQLSSADVIFIGETHNCPIAHWIEYSITEDMAKKHGRGLVLGAEMLERDNQLLVDEYVSGLITSDRFETEAKIWDNHYTDYAPLLYLARVNSLKFVATNVPRRYASLVKDNGLDCLQSLSEEAKGLMAPLPISFDRSASDESMFGLMMAVSGHGGNPSFFPEAQALKDATMAWSISENLDRKFIHYNGNFHSDFHSGIIPYLNEYHPGLKIMTVCCVRQESVSRLDDENKGRADFIVCVPESMTTTF